MVARYEELVFSSRDVANADMPIHLSSRIRTVAVAAIDTKTALLGDITLLSETEDISPMEEMEVN